MSSFQKFICWSTGAKEYEQKKAFLTFIALFCLLISYYLIKPLRNSKFLEEFHPSRLPLIYAGVAVFSFSVTKVFSHFAQKVEKYKLVSRAYFSIILCKLALGNWLQSGGKAPVVFFYFFASVYFLLAIATLWACINDMFTPDQSKRCFGFIALGSTLGSIVGSRISSAISSSVYRDSTLCFSVSFMFAALVFILLAKRSSVKSPNLVSKEKGASPAEAGEFWDELNALRSRPYIRRIGLTVLFLALATTAIEFITQTSIDRELSRAQYQQTFSDLESISFEEVYELKTMNENQKEIVFSQWAQSEVENPEALFEQYRRELEIKTRIFFAQTYGSQGIVGVFFLLVVARFLFSRIGMRYCFTLLPLVALTGLCLLAFTIDLFLVQVVLVSVGAVNFSLNNAAKEILYCATDEETLFRFKPMIEGPGMRTGDVLSSLLKLFVGVLTTGLALSEFYSTKLFLLITMLVLIAWIRVAWLAGKEYDEKHSD